MGSQLSVNLVRSGGQFYGLVFLKFRNLREPLIDYSFRENGFQEMAAESINVHKKE